MQVGTPERLRKSTCVTPSGLCKTQIFGPKRNKVNSSVCNNKIFSDLERKNLLKRPKSRANAPNFPKTDWQEIKIVNDTEFSKSPNSVQLTL